MRACRASAETRVALLLAMAAGIATCERVQAQDAPRSGEESGTAAFVDAARRAAVPYRDRTAAIRAGYRRLGPSFPGMGEHWIHPGIIVRSSFSPAEPSVLCYADVDGEPQLVAVAYAFPLGPGAPLPPLPGGPDVWHVHDGSVAEETLLLTHRHAQGRKDAMRLVMTHVWTELENPDGVFAQNNWRLPFVQAGIPLNDPPGVDAGHAASLLTAGVAYYDRLFTLLAEPSGEERVHIRRVLEETRTHVEIWRKALGTRPAGDADLRILAEIWTTARDALLAGVGPSTAERLRSFGGAASSHAHEADAKGSRN